MSIATIQEASGATTRSAGQTTVAISLGAGTVAGNTVLIFITSPTGLTPPAGMANDKVIGTTLWAFRASEVAAAETTWTFTYSGAGPFTFTWYIVEKEGMDPAEPLDSSATATATSVANGATKSTGTAPLNAALNTEVFAVFAVNQAGAGDTQSWDGYTNDLLEVCDVASNVAGVYQLAVAAKTVEGTTGTFESTATLTTSAGSAQAMAMVLAYRAANSPIVAPLTHLAGFEWGTHGGINSHATSSNMLGYFLPVSGGVFGTSYLIQAGSARNSNYGLRVVQAADAVAISTGVLAGASCAVGLDVRVVSATGTVVVASLPSRAQLLYDTATSKFGVRAGTTGTVSWQSGTTPINTWVWVDLRAKIGSSTWRVEWRLETGAGIYTDQPAAELTGQSPTTLTTWTMGHSVAQTMTADFDNVVLSNYYSVHPLGPHQVRLLTPAGTATVVGTTISQFTANGTLAAINAATAASLVDEVPPTVSASADGVCQTAVGASDYIEFPMAAPTLAVDEVCDGVRELAAMWGGTGTGTGTVGVRAWDGTTESVLIAASTSYDAGSPTVISSTEPRWECAMWPFVSGGWTQAKLDALALRFGFSTDATPDMGCHALYLEYATRKATVATVLGEAGSVAVASNVDPGTLGVRALVTTTPADQGTTLNWTDAGGPHTQVVAASSTDTQTLDAGAGEVSFVEVVSDNLPADRP